MNYRRVTLFEEALIFIREYCYTTYVPLLIKRVCMSTISRGTSLRVSRMRSVNVGTSVNRGLYREIHRSYDDVHIRFVSMHVQRLFVDR
jgi:hypothetical protein